MTLTWTKGIDLLTFLGKNELKYNTYDLFYGKQIQF